MSVEMEMPRYVSHKQVWALKIKAIEPFGADGMFARLHFEDPRYAPIAVDADWYYGRKPEAGGYYVVYKDGYTSYSPAKAFDEGYTPENAAQAVASAEPSDEEILRVADEVHQTGWDFDDVPDGLLIAFARALLSRYGQAPAADGDALREAVKIAYGYLWHVNTEPGTPNQYAPERAAYKARIVLREQLTKDERGEGINVVRAAMRKEGRGDE